MEWVGSIVHFSFSVFCFLRQKILAYHHFVWILSISGHLLMFKRFLLYFTATAAAAVACSLHNLESFAGEKNEPALCNVPRKQYPPADTIYHYYMAKKVTLSKKSRFEYSQMHKHFTERINFIPLLFGNLCLSCALSPRWIYLMCFWSTNR